MTKLPSTLCCLAMLGACGEPAASATSAGKPGPAVQGEQKMTRIEIDDGTRRWAAQIDDSPAARDFLAQLPLRLTLEDYAATEKIATLPRRLTREQAPASTTPRAGDVTYYAPWGNLAIFHRDGPPSPGLIILGRITTPYADLARPGKVTVTITRGTSDSAAVPAA